MPIFKWIPYALFIISISCAEAALPTPGLWNVTATVTIEGAAKSYGPYYRSQCLSQEDMGNPEKLLSNSGIPNCSYSNISNHNNRLDFAVQCSGDIPMSGQGSVNYAADKFEGSIDITADLQGLSILTHSQVSGKHAGECIQ